MATDSNPEHCACGCHRTAPAGRLPRFVDDTCRKRWIALTDITAPTAVRKPALLADDPQPSPPSSAPVAATEVAEAQAEFAQRITVAPQVETALDQAPSGMWVQPRPGALLRFLIRAARKVR
jgi:hypothetical protein